MSGVKKLQWFFSFVKIVIVREGKSTDTAARFVSKKLKNDLHMFNSLGESALAPNSARQS